MTAFEELLKSEYQATFAQLLTDHGTRFAGSVLTLTKEGSAFAELNERGWATPEILDRDRPVSHAGDLERYMAQHHVTAVVAAPRGGPTPSLLIALGEKKNRWPFTYPEIERLQNIAELMDNVLTHARLTAEAALQARLEHLAMMSRGLAHDLKNLITPVSSFLIHTESRLAPNTVEAEVHAAAKRSVALMTEYVREALFFANRLNPRFETTSVRELLDSAADIARIRARGKGIHITLSSDRTGSARLDHVLIQRMLVNLLHNAIDACNNGGTVTLSGESGGDGRICLRVEDTGCGIPPENRARIFDPYFTTKQFGDDVRGFGLGLTICEKIVRLHGGDICVTSELGRGTTVSVNLPVEPPPQKAEPDALCPAPALASTWQREHSAA